MPRVRSEARTAIGVDLGGTKLAIGVIDETGRIRSRAIEWVGDADQDELLDLLVGSIQSMLSVHPEVEAVGLGIPCSINREDGMVTGGVNVPLAGLHLGDMIAEQVPRPIFVDNDANVAALGEHWFGAARGTRDAVVLTIGTGVGGGVVLDRRLLRTGGGAGPELGHVVIDYDGPACQGECPNRGCVEAMISGPALAREGRRAAEASPGSMLGQLLESGQDIDARQLIAAARAGDGVAEQVVQRAGARLGVALTSYSNTFGPEMFVIGGGIAAAGDMLLEPARWEYWSRGLGPLRSASVHGAQLGVAAGMVGAAAMALDELVAA